MATAEKTTSAEFRDIGAVREFTFNAPESGVIVLRGANGAGKTTILSAIDAVDRGVGKPPIADGADRGEARLGDVRLQVGKRSQKSGDLEFEILPGKYSIADLIDPPFKSRESCDDHAIKTLAQLAGSGDVTLFYKLVGGKEAFDRLVPGEVAGDLDVVALAARVERVLQGKARVEEEAATGADGKADACSASAGTVDMTLPHDEQLLAEARGLAEREYGALQQKHASTAKAIADARSAQDALEDAEAETAGPTAAEAQTRLEGARKLVEQSMAAVTQLEQQLRNAKESLSKAESLVREAETVVQSVANTERALAKFRAIVAAAQNIEPVSEAELAAARGAVEKAKNAELAGGAIRIAIASREQADTWRKKAAEHRKAAESLRQMAAGTDDVLSGLVATLGSPLFVERGRLLTTSDRGKESFWELSDGERSEAAVTVFANAVRNRSGDPTKPCRLALPQSFWEGLDWQGRNRIAELMKRLKVQAWTAECDRDKATAGPLRAEVYQG